MLQAPKDLPNRPSPMPSRENGTARAEPDRADVLGDVLGRLNLATLVYSRVELEAPWGLRIGEELAGAEAHLYVIGEGEARLEPARAESIVLSAGDVALVPNGGVHVLRDNEGGHVDLLGGPGCPFEEVRKLRPVGNGRRTTLVGGAFRFGATERTPLLEHLPEVIHISASDPAAAPWLPATVQLLLSESIEQRPGGSVVMSRLVDVLFVHVLRTFAGGRMAASHSLCALADPQIGRALQLVHDAPAAKWTVESLASAVAMSRSAFAERFTRLVGHPPLEYIGRWRMAKAAELLAGSELSVGEVAERVGYASEAAFNRAFKRYMGAAPATWRRRHPRGPVG